MTLPFERTNAIEGTRQFLLSLLDPKKTPRVPREIRRQAGQCLRHFPNAWDIETAKRKCPEVFGNTPRKRGEFKNGIA